MARQYKFSTAVNKVRKNNNDSGISSFDEAVETIRANRQNTNYLTEIDRENRHKAFEESQRQARQRAIELAKTSTSSSSNANAGDNRTTAYNRPQSMSVYGGLGTMPNPQTQGMNTAANGADIDYTTVNQTANNGWKGLSALNGSRASKKTVSQEESLANATEVMKPYENNSKAMEILRRYSDLEDSQDRSGMLNFQSIGAYSGNFDKLANQFIEETGVSMDEFRNIAKNYSYLKHNEQREEAKARKKEQNAAINIAQGIGEAAISPLTNYQAMIGAMQQSNDPELGRDYNSPFMRHLNAQEDTKEAFEAKTENLSPVAKTLANLGYDLAVTGTQSAAAALTGEVGLGSFAAGGYASNLEESDERGLTEGQAQVYSAVSGGLEYITERLPIEHLKKIYNGSAIGKSAAGSLKPYIKAALEQMGEEASEELINGIADTVADGLINGDKSKVNATIQNNINNGMSEDEATRSAYLGLVKDTGYSMLVAALSTGVSAGPALAGQARSSAKAGRDIAKDNAYLTRDTNSPFYISEDRNAYVADEDYKQAQDARQTILNASEKVDKGQRISGKEARAVYEKAAKALESLNARRNVEAVKAEEGITNTSAEKEQVEYKAPAKTNEQIIEDIEFASTPYQLAQAIDQVTEETDEIRELIEYKRQELEMYNFNSSDVDNAVTEKKAFEMGQRGEEVTEEQLNAIPEADRQKILEANNQAFNKSVLAEHPDAVVDKTTGKYFAPAEVKVEGADVVIVDSEGNAHTDYENPKINQAMSVVTKTSKDARGHITDQSIYQSTPQQAAYAVELALKSPEATSALIKTAVEAIYDSASVGHTSFEDFEKNSKGLFTKVDKTAAKFLYNAVAENARKSDARKTENTAGKKTSDKAVSDTLREALPEETTALLEALSEKIGYNFVASTNKNARGSINPGTRQISIGTNSVDEVWSIVAHEAIGEYLQAHGNEADVLAIQDDMFKYLEGKLGSDAFNDLINQYQSVYRTGAKTGSVDYGKSRRAAANEMFNDTIFALLSSEEGVKDYVSWLNEGHEKSFFEKVKDFFSKLVQSIRDYIDNGSFNPAERAALEMDYDQAKAMRDRIFKAMDAAIATVNYTGVAAKKNSITPENLERSSKYVNTDKLEDILIDHNYIAAVDDELLDFANDIEAGTNTKKELVVNKTVSDRLANDIEAIVGFNVKDFSEVLGKNAVSHIFAKHGKNGKSDHSMSDNADLARIKYILENYDEIAEGKGTRKFHNADGSNAKTVVMMQKIGDKYHYVVEAVPDTNSHRLQIISAYINEKDTLPRVANPNGFAATSETDTSDSASLSTFSLTSEKDKSTDNLSKNDEEIVNDSRKSISVDSDGNSLSEGQQEYFADSKIRDDQGRLKVMYHGTQQYGFTVFDKKKAKGSGYYGRGFYFSSEPSHAGQYGEQYKVYLNITNPMQSGDHNITKDQLRAFVESVAEDEDYGIDNYGYDATVDSVTDDIWSKKDDFAMLQDINAACVGDFVAAVKLFNEINGTDYDGIVVPTETVAFESNQIKNVDNLNPTADEDIRFSLKAPVEETKSLIAVHNLHVDDMLRTLDLGGFPMPSIAITKPEMGHDMYGNVSVIFNKDTIDPKFMRANKVYSGDAYTPTFPSIGYKIDSDKIYDIREKIDKLLGDDRDSFGYMGLDTDNVTDYLERNKGNVVDAFSNKDGYKYAFIKDKGFKVDIPMKESRLSVDYDNDTIKYIALMFTPEQALESFQNAKETYDEFNKDGRMEKVIEKINASEKKSLGPLYKKYRTTEVSFREFDQLLNSINKYYRDGIKQEIDKLAFNDAVNDVINNNRADYENWLRDLFDGVIVKQGIRNQKDTFTPSGNRRSWDSLHDEYNLMNIVKAMKSEPDVGIGFGGFNIFGSVNREFESIDDIHSEEGRLQLDDQEKYDKIKDEISKDLYDIARHLIPSPGYDAYSIVSDIAEAAAKRKTRSGIKNFLSEWYEVSESDMDDIMDIIERAKSLPTGYFEAKPQRAVGFDEIANVIVPDLETELISKLEEKNIPYTTYKAGDKEARKKALNSLPDVRFSKKVDWDKNNTYKVPERTYDAENFFNLSDEEMDAAEEQDILAKSYIANIIHSKNFAGLMFIDNDGLQRLLTKSTRKGYDWQLTESRDGEPIGHDNYINENDDVTSYDSWPRKTLAALYNDMLNIIPMEGTEIHVIREGIAEDARNSIKVYGEASPYADSINETKVISTMLGSMNNSLSQVDAFNVSNEAYMQIEKSILKKYNAQLEEGELAANVSFAFAYMQQNKLETNYDKMMNYLLNIGDEVIKNSNLKDPESEQLYNSAKDVVKKYTFKLSEADREEIKTAFGGNWKTAFGELQKAGIKLNNDKGVDIDTVFSQLQSEFLQSAGINLEKYDKPSEQILGLLDAMHALEPTAYLWDGANSMDKALTVVADIINDYYSIATGQLASNVVKGTKKGKETVAAAINKEKDKLNQKFREYKANKTDEFNQIVAEKNRIIQEQQNQIKQQNEQMKKWNAELSDKDKQIQQAKVLTEKQMKQTAKLQAREAVESYRQREERARQIENIKKTGIRLIKWLNNPTDNQHVPAFLQKPLGEFLAAIDFLPKNAKADSKSTLTWQQRMQSLRDTLVKIKDAEAEADGSVEAYFAENMIAKELISMMDDFLGKETWDEFTQSYIVTKRAASKVSLLDAKDLATLNKIMSALSASINNMNKTYANSVFKEVSKLAKASVKEIDALPDKKDQQKMLGKIFNFLNFDEVEPITYFEGLGSGAKSIYQELREGFNLKTKHVREADAYMDAAKKELGISDKELSTWKNQLHTFKLTEGTVMLNTTQIMSLYKILGRKQGKPHVAVGGIKSADFEYKDGKVMKKHHQAKAVHIMASEAQAIINTLTPEQIALADKMQQFMANDCAKWGNRVTEKMFGYKKYEEKDYFPLKTDAHSRATTASSDNNVSYYTIKNSSFTKPITPMANNAVMLEDIFDVFTDHVVSMADYDAYVMPIADAMRWFNYSERVINAVAPDELNEQGARVDYIGNMQESIDRVYGDAGLNYFRQFIKDINGDYAGRGGKSEILSSLMSMYKAQAVGANMRVVIQQPTAVVRASDVIEPKYLIEAMGSLPKAMEYAKKAQTNSEIAYWKAQGYYETYLGQSFKEIITGDVTLKDKFNDWSGFLAGQADDLSWGIMYRAAELKVAKEQPELKGSAFDKAATKIFEDIVDHTQVVDTIFHKSQWMRSQELGHKVTSAFMAEPTKTYNMLYRAYRDAKLSGDRSYAVKRLRNVALIFLFEQLLNAMITGAWDMLRDDEKEDYLASFKKNFSENAIDNLNPLNLLPIAKEITSAIQGYDATSYTTDAIYTAVDSFNAIVKIIRGESKKTVWGNTYQVAKTVSQLTGVPVANVMREFKTVYNLVNDFWGGKDLFNSQTTQKKVEKNKETKRISKVFETGDLGLIKSEITNTYNNAIADGKTESDAWKAAREMLKSQYKIMVEANPDDKAAINNRFRTLLKYTKESNHKGGYKTPSDKEISNWIEKWNKPKE